MSKRWFRSKNRFIRHRDSETPRGINSLEWAFRPGEYGPYLGVHLTKNDGSSDDHVLYVGFILGRVWLHFGRSEYGNPRRWGAELGRKMFEFYWGCEDKFGNWENGPHICCFWWDRLIDFMFGKRVHLTERQTRSWQLINDTIPMPEGEYPAVFTYETRIWYRPRSPFRIVRYATDIDIPIGIPFSGKGENSWDCGEDGLYGCGISSKRKEDGHDVPRAKAYARDAALKDREKRGDAERWPMKPEDRIAAMESRKAAQP